MYHNSRHLLCLWPWDPYLKDLLTWALNYMCKISFLKASPSFSGKVYNGEGQQGCRGSWNIACRVTILLIPNCSGIILLYIWFTLALLPHYFNFDTEFVGVYNSVQLWHHLELAQTPHVKDLLPQNSTQPYSTPFHKNKSQIVACNSDRPVINHRFPRTPQVQLFARTTHRMQGMIT